MAITVGTLVVDLAANTASFVSGLDKAGQISLTSATKMRRAFENLAASAVVAFTAIETAVVAAVDRAIKNADRLHDVAQATGMTTAALSALEYAAKQSGLSTEQLDKSLQKMAKSMFAAAEAGTKGQNAYKTLGIALTDATGRLRPTQDVLLQLAGQFSRTEDGAWKTAIAMQVFGKSGADLVPFLNQGEEGIARLTAEAERLGVVIDTATARAADEFADSLKKLEGAADGAANRLTTQLLPSFQLVVDNIIAGAEDSQTQFAKTAEFAGGMLKIFLVVFSGVQTVFDSISEHMRHLFGTAFSASEALQKAQLALLHGHVGEALQAFKDGNTAIEEDTKLSTSRLTNLWKDYFAGVEQFWDPQKSGWYPGKGKGAPFPLRPGPVVQAGDGDAADKAAAAIRRKIEALEAAAAAEIKEAAAQQGDTAATWLHIAAIKAQKEISDLNAQADEKKIKHLTASQEAQIRSATVLKMLGTEMGQVSKSLADQVLNTNEQTKAQRALNAAYAEGGAAIAKAQEDAQLAPFRAKVEELQKAFDGAKASGDKFSSASLGLMATALLHAKGQLAAMTDGVREFNAVVQEGNTKKLILDTDRWTESQRLLSKAIFGGAAAMRELFIAQKRAEFIADKSQDQSQLEEYIASLRAQLEVQRLIATGEKLDSTRRRKDLDDELTALRELRAQLIANGATTLEIDAAIHTLALQKIHDQADLLLQMESAGAGAKAFFLSYGKNATDAQRAFDMLSRGFDDLSSNIAKALTGQKASWHDFLTSLAEEFTKFLLNKAFQKLFSFLGGFLGGGGGGGGGGFSLSSLPLTLGLGIGGLQEGGAALAGQSYLVGEDGEEIFTPGVSGTILPNSALGGETTVVNQYVTMNVQTPDADSFNRSQDQIAGDFAAAMARAARRK